ncbi:allantoinase AllB [Mumia sp. ZJ1417]|uniref:allantoinase AllB n=1 Tax=unclassified Mumia TaxID=2621872 RepID=UPI00141F1438|nr:MULTISPECIES: allantoinase AllB [unclassified Mumia]QMW65855.1 allantoinase AllB [Mumia sp. ZJ1417]
MAIHVVRAERALVDGVLQPAQITVRDGVVVGVSTGSTGDGGGSTDGGGGGGAYLLPGVVDTHVHINEPGRTAWEGFATATEAAARGGVTTLVDMPLNSIPPTTTPAALALKRECAAGQLRVDTGFWGGAVPDSLGSLEALWDEGVYGFKCFLVDSGVPEFAPLDGDQLQAAMREIGGFGGLLLVHAEDPGVIASASARPSRAYADFVASRPDGAEVAAIASVVDAVRETGTRTHLVHLSSARALDLIAEARAEGLPLTVETCPHYLVLDAASVPDGAAAYKCCPPIRDRGNQDALWDALVDGIIDCIVSDHSPTTLAEKARGDGDLQQAWGGIAGLQVGFAAVADAASRRGIGLAQVSAWMSAGPARIAGIKGKGAIAVGNDADLVWWSPGGSYEVRADALAHKNKLSAYDGLTLRGRVLRTDLRGEPVGPVPDSGSFPPLRDRDEVEKRPNRGRLLRR